MERTMGPSHLHFERVGDTVRGTFNGRCLDAQCAAAIHRDLFGSTTPKPHHRFIFRIHKASGGLIIELCGPGATSGTLEPFGVLMGDTARRLYRGLYDMGKDPILPVDVVVDFAMRQRPAAPPAHTPRLNGASRTLKRGDGAPV